MSASAPGGSRPCSDRSPRHGRVHAGPAHVVRDRHAAAVHLGQHDRHLRLHAGEAAVALPAARARLLFGQMRRVVGRDHVHHALAQRLPQRFLVPRLADRWIDA